MRTVDRIRVVQLLSAARIVRVGPKVQRPQVHSRVDAYLAWIVWYPKVVTSP